MSRVYLSLNGESGENMLKICFKLWTGVYIFRKKNENGILRGKIFLFFLILLPKKIIYLSQISVKTP